MFIFAILGICFLGWWFTHLLSDQYTVPERLGLSFLFGIQILTLALFVSNFWLGIRLTAASAWSIWLALALMLFSATKFKLPHFRRFHLVWPATWGQKLLLAILIILPVANLLVSFWQPVLDWDAVTMFDFRAKIILHTGWIQATLFRSSVLAYPLLTTLSHYWLYINGLNTAMPLYPLFYAAFILVSFSQLQRVVPKIRIFPATLILAVTPKLFDQSLIAYANLPYTIYLVLGAAYLFFWTRDHRKPDLILGVTLSLLSLWARSFPFALVNLFVALVFSVKTRRLTWVAAGLSALVMLKVFWPLDWPRLLSVLTFTKWAVFDYFFPYTWILVLLTLRQIFVVRKGFYWPLLLTLYFGLYIVGNYYFSGIYADYAGIPDAAQRMVMFINPAIVWYLFTVI
jgi:hypothetical protein